METPRSRLPNQGTAYSLAQCASSLRAASQAMACNRAAYGLSRGGSGSRQSASVLTPTTSQARRATLR